MADNLVAIEAIKRLKAYYFYCLDRKLWDGWRNDVFMPDVVVEVPSSWAQPLVGIDAFVDRVSKNTVGAVTIHHGHMPIIDIIAPGHAAGIWAMEDVIHFSPENLMQGKYSFMHEYGHYHETYLETERGWRIATLRLDRLHLERR